jgi:hypothetical protein
MPSSNFTPKTYDFIHTRGDTVLPVEFGLKRDGVAWTVDSAVAQVREAKNRASTLILTLTDVVATGKVTVGGDQLTSINPGTYYWDLQVTDGTEVLTLVAGKFVVLNDITHVSA